MLFVFIYFNSWVLFGLILLALLQLYLDFSRYKSSINTALTINIKTKEIQIENDGDSNNFDQFRLYSNCWFLILLLRKKGSSQSLLLLSQRFHSMSEYLLFRYQIKKMNQNINVD